MIKNTNTKYFIQGIINNCPALGFYLYYLIAIFISFISYYLCSVDLKAPFNKPLCYSLIIFIPSYYNQSNKLKPLAFLPHNKSVIGNFV